jgi:4-oxalocrotonate tautomerase
MPRINIELIEGRSVEQKRQIVESFTETIVKVLRVEPEVVTVRFDEVPAHNMAKAGKLRSDV